MTEFCPDPECVHEFPHRHDTHGVSVPGQSAWSEHWHEFVACIELRLDTGAREYGDDSFTSPPLDTVQEIQEELLDVVGWSYILWCKLHKLQAALETRDEQP